MEAVGPASGGVYAYEAADVPCHGSGSHGYTLRVLPYHRDEGRAFLPGLIRWADGQLQ
jgi:hypothetical protein